MGSSRPRGNRHTIIEFRKPRTWRACPGFLFCAQPLGLQAPLRLGRQEISEKADRRQEAADAIDEGDVRQIGDLAERRGTKAGDAESKAEEEAGNGPDPAR